MKTGAKRNWIWVAAGLVASGVAMAAVSPLLISASVDGAGLLTVQTDRLPKGWFNAKNAFDRNKSNLQTAYALGATACSPVKPGGVLNSTADGSFTTENNSQGHTIGYYYTVAKDLSVAQNRWYLHKHCDGSVETHGCDAAIPVTVTTTAYDKAGACHTYVDDAGVTRCASDSASGSLPAVQDDDVVDTACGGNGDSCGIGACVSSCEQAANAAYDGAKGAADAQLASCATGQAGKPCREAAQAAAKAAHDAFVSAKQACPCNCKAQLPPSCPQYNACADD